MYILPAQCIPISPTVSYHKTMVSKIHDIAMIFQGPIPCLHLKLTTMAIYVVKDRHLLLLYLLSIDITHRSTSEILQFHILWLLDDRVLLTLMVFSCRKTVIRLLNWLRFKTIVRHQHSVLTQNQDDVRPSLGNYHHPIP